MRAAAVRRMEAAYGKAIIDYTKAGQDDRALAAEKKLDQFGRTEIFPPGRYAVTYAPPAGEAVVEIAADGTFTRSRQGATAAGVVTFVGGKLVQKGELYIEVWTPKAGSVAVEHFYPLATYPRGKLNASGTVKRLPPAPTP